MTTARETDDHRSEVNEAVPPVLLVCTLYGE